MNKRDLLVRAAVASFVRGRAAQELRDVKAELDSIMDAGDRSYAMIDDGEVATVSKTRASSKPVVADEAALLEWCKRNRPDVVREMVAPWFTAAGSLARVIEETGEVPDGVEVVDGEPSISVRVSTNQGEALAEALLAGKEDVLYLESHQ